MNNQWLIISKKLFDIYKEENIIDFFEEDEKYLRDAFYTIEELWNAQFDEIDKIKVILISEAPLFGKDKSYIYNENTKPSSFFHFNDITVFPQWNKNIKRPKLIKDQKKLMIEEFSKNGLIVLDIFPFAFNEHNTKLNYRTMNKNLYKKLLEITRENYLLPKLNKCLSKSTKDIKFLYRYKRLFEKTSNHFDDVLNNLNTNKTYKTNTINGENMSLDRIKLENFLND